MPTNEKKSAANIAVVSVFNSNHDGYRRAGFRLNAGANTLTDVSQEQFKLLEADPDLAAQIVEAAQKSANPQNAQAGQAGGQVLAGSAAGSSLTKAELLTKAVSDWRLNPDAFQTKQGELSIKAFRTAVCDDLTLDEVKAEIDKAAE